jgi:hypothetical protein
MDAPKADADAARITLSRRDPRDCQQRQVFARVDDGESVVLAFGEAETLSIAPGTHLLRVHNTLYRKRLEFTVGAGEHVAFNIINASPGWSGGLATVLGWAPLKLTIEAQRALEEKEK